MLKQNFLLTLAALTTIFLMLIFLLPTPAVISEPQSAQSNTQSETLIIKNARIFDGTTLLENTDMVIEGAMIAAIGRNLETPESAAQIDGTGKTIFPGLIDAHTHTFGTALEDSLRFGVTTNLDMFMLAALMTEAQPNRDKTGPTNQADLYSAGALATVKGGHGTQYGFPIETLTSPDDARDWVVRRKAEGSDYIKLVYIPGQTSIPSLDLETATHIIEAAHAEGLMALAHISTQAAAMDMVNEGIDGLVHLFADEPVSDAFIQRALDTDLFIIPTLTVIAGISGSTENAALAEDPRLAPFYRGGQAGNLAQSFGIDIPGFDLSIALANTGKLHAAGVTILAGSDAPNPGTTHGASLHHELELLVRSGLSTTDALAAATALPAQAFSLEGRGVLRPGARADFVLTASNPADDITATRDIVSIYKNGHEVQRPLAATPKQNAALQAQLGTFDNGLDAPTGFYWTSTDDSFAGGTSSANVSADGAGHLNVKATITNDFLFPWAGAFLTIQDRATPPASLSDFDTLTFQVRGTPGTYRVMMFDTGIAGAPPTQNFTISEDWQDITMALDDFNGFTPNAFVGLAIVAGPATGEFEYQIDNVILN